MTSIGGYGGEHAEQPASSTRATTSIMKILKYPLQPSISQKIDLPEGGRVIHLGVQKDNVFIWVLVDPSRPSIPREFNVVPTGYPMTEAEFQSKEHIGSLIMDPFVWHIFAEKQRSET